MATAPLASFSTETVTLYVEVSCFTVPLPVVPPNAAREFSPNALLCVPNAVASMPPAIEEAPKAVAFFPEATEPAPKAVACAPVACVR